MDSIDKFLKLYSYKFDKGYPDMNNEQDILMLENILKELNIDLTLKEAALSPTELNKPYTSRHELAGQYEDRGERFLEKIIKKQEFELNDGSKIIIDVEKSAEAIKNLKDKKYNAFGRGSKILIDTEGNTYSLSSFKKTSEFGSGKGMGGGAASTAIQESSQSVVNAIAYNVKKGQLSEEDLTEENIKEAFKFSDISSSLEEVLDFIKNQPSWTNTFISTANILLSNFSNSSFQQHRGSSFVDSIYEAYKAAKKGAGISMQADKWNPADIWMVDASILSTQFPTELKELNALLVDLYAENKLIGVSLKKTGKEAKIGTYNLSEEDKEGYTYTNSDSKPTNNSVSIVYSDGVITFRTFNFASNFAGEIKGKTASHGKIGQGAINDVLRENNLPLLPSPKDLQSKFKSKDEDLIEDFYSNYNKVVEGISKEEFDAIVDSKDLNWLISKYMSTKLASTIETQDQSTQDEIISDMIRYASSATKSSSVFAKVS